MEVTMESFRSNQWLPCRQTGRNNVRKQSQEVANWKRDKRVRIVSFERLQCPFRTYILEQCDFGSNTVCSGSDFCCRSRCCSAALGSDAVNGSGLVACFAAPGGSVVGLGGFAFSATRVPLDTNMKTSLFDCRNYITRAKSQEKHRKPVWDHWYIDINPTPGGCIDNIWIFEHHENKDT